jgi:nucleoside diphosphate kinase
MHGVSGGHHCIAHSCGCTSSPCMRDCFLILLYLQRNLVGEIISRFEKKGFKVVGLRMVSGTFRSCITSAKHPHALNNCPPFPVNSLQVTVDKGLAGEQELMEQAALTRSAQLFRPCSPHACFFLQNIRSTYVAHTHFYTITYTQTHTHTDKRTHKHTNTNTHSCLCVHREALR